MTSATTSTTVLFGQDAILSLMEPNKQYRLKDLVEMAIPYYPTLSYRSRYDIVQRKLGALRKKGDTTTNGYGLWTRLTPVSTLQQQ